MIGFFRRNARDPVSSCTHFWGAVGGALATVLMLVHGLRQGAAPLLVAGAVLFGLSLVALYTASSVYHFWQGAPEKLVRLRKLDHSMIYVLIAGSYTPLCLAFMPGSHGVRFAAVMWGLALAGILIKLCWLSAPRILYTALYLAMGWAIVFDHTALVTMPTACLVLLAAGGVMYSVGAVCYILKKPNFSSSFGFHELFHLFILAGSALHVATVYFYVL